jgi:monovalent cation:H+ antiporter-2, CPA2 family
VSELPLLVTIAVAVAYALVGGLLARRMGLPTIVGYLIAGVALGPFTPGFRGDDAAIHELAEFGVILLMFGIGMHFSFRDLWQVRDIAIPGALLQMAATTALAYGLARYSGASPASALVLGIAVSVASTVVLLRGLTDLGLLNSLHGRVAVGWLVLEDLATVVILVLLPLLSLTGGPDRWHAPLIAVGKALAFVVLMLMIGRRLVPVIMTRVVRTRSRELFVLAALCAAAGTALTAAEFFGVSLALGAFLAGVIFGESEFSHQVSADLLPFREAFAVLFFVSVGMLVNPAFLAGHWREVLLCSAVIIVGKWAITVATGVLFPYPARTSLVVAAGLSQIGEFSFILGQSALALGLISADQYSLILAGAIVSITANPLMFRLIDPVERRLRRWPRVWRWLDRPPRHDAAPPSHDLAGHVVIVGCGRVGRHIAEALGRLQVPRLVVEADPARLAKLHDLGVPVLYGDASNSEILAHASLPGARALVITLPDDAAALAVAMTARGHAPDLPIVARASTWDGARRLRAAGVTDVVRPELEGGVEIVRRTLLDLDFPALDVQRYADRVRDEGLDEAGRTAADRSRPLDELIGAAHGVDMTWLTIHPDSPLAGRTIGDSALRTRTGASIVAVASRGGTRVNPDPGERLRAGDRLAIIGTPAQVRLAGDAIRPSTGSA